MDLMLSAKGSDVTAWRAVENFAAAYRLALLDRAASDHSGSCENVFSATCTELEKMLATHQEILKHLESLIEKAGTATPSTNLKELTATFYSDLYRHFDHFRSAPAFYQLSMAFLRQMSATIFSHTSDQLGLFARHIPEMTLAAVGPAGSCEYSPLGPLQVLLIHGEVSSSQLQTINLFCHALHDGFEDAGLSVDPVVTPRNPLWRGTQAEWKQRCEDGVHPKADEGFTNLCRLVDLCPLSPDNGHAMELRDTCHATLNGNRSALTNLRERMSSFSNGLGLMGGLKLERRGSVRGLFGLQDFGLRPFSAALSALVLVKNSRAVSNIERINDLLRRRELDVDLAERMLATWYSLHGLRLWREQSLRIEGQSGGASFLDPDEMTAEQRQELKKSLESVAIIQRNIDIIFSGMGE